jgi:hypothetical protein
MLDISRDKVPTMQTLFELVDLLAHLKINQLQLYTEHTFAYRDHEIVWKDASPMTGDEIRQLDAYCRERFIELVPNQNSFGHLERWFKHPQYAHLAEKPDGFTSPFGNRIPTGFSLNPTDPRSLEFLEGLFDELLPNFTSKQFNVGCDETFDLGLGRSKAEVEKRGRERVYLDFVSKVHDAVKRRGLTMQFWGDIILRKPELLDQLPRDHLIALNWGYEADHPFEIETRAFRDAGVPFYVCPGTSSWCSISGRTDNAIGNLQNAAVNGLKHGAIGYLITDWGDHGHLQYLPVSYLALAAGAAYSWCYQANRDLDIAAALDRHIFRDSASVMGRLMMDFGRICAGMSPLKNGTRLFWTLINGDERKRLYEDVTVGQYEHAEQAIGKSMARIGEARIFRADARLIADELHNAAAMLRYACEHGITLRDSRAVPERTSQLAQDLRRIVEEHRRLWLARNRPGGLDDSAERLGRNLQTHQA